ncbi:MAG: AAA family ATPase [Bacteroidales bacterium]|nr:AAA family ATPase [Bacteroidales bacterium]
MFERSELQILKKRINEPRRFIQVVLGPRQVGKTTMVNQLFHQLPIPGLYESADAVYDGDSIWLQQIWETARLKMAAQNANEFLLIIDEIQKVPNWSETVKKLWDEDSRNNLNIKLILLGSSRLLVQKGLTESLAGRFETIHLTHWSYSEMKEAFGWNARQYVWFGGYPGSAVLIDDEPRWKNYLNWDVCTQDKSCHLQK